MPGRSRLAGEHEAAASARAARTAAAGTAAVRSRVACSRQRPASLAVCLSLSACLNGYAHWYCCGGGGGAPYPPWL